MADIWEVFKNFTGEDNIESLKAAFKFEGKILTKDGEQLVHLELFQMVMKV